MNGRLWWAVAIQVVVGGVGLALLGPSGLLAGAPVAGLLVPVGRRTWWAIVLGATVLAVVAIAISGRISGHLNTTGAGLGGGLLAVLLAGAASLLLALAAAKIRPALVLKAPRRSKPAADDPLWPKWDQPAGESQETGVIAQPQSEAKDAPARPLSSHPPEMPSDPPAEGGLT